MSSTGKKQTESSSLNNMLQQVGIDDIGAFVNQFRSKVDQENANTASAQQQPDYASMGSSFLNQLSGGSGSKKGQGGGSGDLISGAFNAYKMFSGGKGGSSGQGQAASGGSSAGGNPMDMINSAMKVYKMVSGGKDATGGTNMNANANTGAGGGGNILDNIGAAYGTAQQLQGFLKQLDRNGDGKVTLEDVQLLLQGLGLGSVSGNVSKALFKAVDRNGDGELDLSDGMALAAIVSKLTGRFGSQGVNQRA